MITAYCKEGVSIHTQSLEVGDALPQGALWIDLQNPDEQERQYILSALGVDLPNMLEMEEIEASSRLYTEGSAVFLTCTILIGADSPNPEMGDLTFVVTPTHVVTTRYCEPRALSLFAARARRQPDFLNTSDDALLAMLDAITDRTADTIEAVSRTVDDLSRRIFREQAAPLLSRASRKPRRRKSDRPYTHHANELNEVLHGIGQSGDVVHKIRDSLNNLQRLQTFMGTQLMTRLTGEQIERFKTLNRDVQSLADNAVFLAHEVNFLLNATLGLISIEQNNIIKIFSIAAVVFLPPTLVGTVYGMNFSHMPGLGQWWGYYLALLLMLISMLLPLWLFRKRGWL